MDIEYEIHCNLDSLVVNDGIHLNIEYLTIFKYTLGLHRNVIHRYCNREQSDDVAVNFVLQERFRVT